MLRRFSKLTAGIMLLVLLIAYSSIEVQADVKTSSPLTESPADGLVIKFIDVGQGDAALIQCGGESMLIDGGPPEASSVLYAILKRDKIDHLKYIVATHPDADHIGGLPGALNYATVQTCYSPVTKHDAKPFNTLVKTLLEQKKVAIVPSLGEKIKLGSAEVTFLGPVETAEDTNNNSLVVRIQHGENRFLFMGDAEELEESQILDKWQDMRSDVLKIGHHGSLSSTTDGLLIRVQPEYAIISVGKGNTYGHPTEQVLSRLNAAKATIYRTDLQGDITVTSDGTNLYFSFERIRKEGNVSYTLPSEDITYVLNTGSMKFHLPTCESVMDMNPQNRQDVTITRKEVVDMGYIPCRNCEP